MITSRDLFNKRKQNIDEAYTLALQFMQQEQQFNEWDLRAIAWCLIDIIKRDAKNGHREHLPLYAEQLQSFPLPNDEILRNQAYYALTLCGNHQTLLNCLRQDVHSGNSSVDLHMRLGWELLHFAKEQNSKHNVQGTKQTMLEYLRLHTERPSQLHSCFLWLADTLAKEEKLRMSDFVQLWGLENLREDDFQRFRTDDGKYLPSLAEKVIGRSCKNAINQHNQAVLQYLLPFVDSAIARFDDNIWLKMRKAQALIMLGQAEQARRYANAVVRKKSRDFWAWELLGDVYKEQALACYCKALLCSKDINFVSKVKIKLARLLIEQGLYAAAKHEIESVAHFREQHAYKMPVELQQMQNESWYAQVEAEKSNRNFYLKQAPIAENLLFTDIPLLIGVVDGVNTQKKLIHFIVDKKIDGIIPFSQLPDKFAVGDAIALRLEQNDTRNRVLNCKKTNEPIPEHLLKTFDGELHLAGSVGFVENIFVPQELLKQHPFTNGALVSGKALLNYDRKKEKWGYKAIEMSACPA